ncbi:hypothetical protein ACFQ3K_16835, partial [Brucella gallinifaecis]
SKPGAGDGGLILLRDSLDGDLGQGVETITFADGATWSKQDLRDKLKGAAATDTHSAIAGQNTIAARDVEPRRLYKTEEKRVAELHAKGYGPDGQPLPGTWFPEKRDPLGIEARRRKEWNEWKDPYFAKHPHRGSIIDTSVSPEQQRLNDVVHATAVAHYKRVAEAADIVPRTPWQRFIGMFTRNQQSEPNSRAFAEMSPLTTDPQASTSEATSLITGSSLNTSTLL